MSWSAWWTGTELPRRTQSYRSKEGEIKIFKIQKLIVTKQFFSFNFQINGGKPHDEFIVDLKRLRRWLRDMENQLMQFPTISDAIKMKDFELERLQKKNEVSWFPPFFSKPVFVFFSFEISIEGTIYGLYSPAGQSQQNMLKLCEKLVRN